VVESSRIAAKIALLAARQRGHVTRVQLICLGLSSQAIQRKVAAGELIPVHTGVYAVGFRSNEPLARAHAAVLACGDMALLSHSSAAVAWGLLRRWVYPLHVTTTGHRRRPGITTHRCKSITRADRRRQHGIPVTSPARTTLDITTGLANRSLVRLLNAGRHAGHLHLDSLRDVIARNPRHPGAMRLAAVVEDAPRNPTRSSLEDDWRAFAKTRPFPEWHLNSRLNGFEVDVVFPAEKLILELDSYEYHSGRAAFETDHERDAVALHNGLATYRMTAERFARQPDYEADRVLDILAARRAEGGR
jgi:very-short-patch-repair endonuclease